MTVLAVLAAILLILALLLWSPARVTVTLFDGKPSVTLRYLFLRFTFPPAKPRKERPKKPRRARKKRPAREREAKETEKPKAPWTGERVQAVIELAKGLLRAAGRSGRSLLRGVHFEEVKLQIMVVRGNACKTAVAAGELNAIAYSAAALLQNYAKIGFLYLNVFPGFWAQEETVAFESTFFIRPGRMAAAVTSLLFGGFSPVAAFLRSSSVSAAGDGGAGASAGEETGQ